MNIGAFDSVRAAGERQDLLGGDAHHVVVLGEAHVRRALPAAHPREVPALEDLPLLEFQHQGGEVCQKQVRGANLTFLHIFFMIY